ncbi:MAG: hypothetical protein GY877_11510 [Hyphomicrobium sp.]|nr:hypothetical protein [Hyphomicrobium sp.]
MQFASVLCFVLLAVNVVFVDAARAQDVSKDLKCTFETGHAWSYKEGEFSSKAPALLTFEITEINLDGQSARLLTDGHDNPGTLKIVRAINANHFLEVVNEGFLNLTTVYDKDPETGAHPAVHSRHFGLMGQPVFAQYAGSCTAK